MPCALLFDMDGTLIENSMDTFLPPYFRALSKKVAAYVTPEKLIAQLQISTRVMMANTDPARSNAQVFADDFFPQIGVPRETLMPLFDDFYLNEYGALRAFIQPLEISRQIVARAFELKHTVVIATAPLFPRNALTQRLAWGNLADFPYALITDYQTMHASKPNPAYYHEIAAQLGVAPSECVMIGNDAQMDIVPAKRAGMQTFWITDVRNAATDTVPADWRGTLADFGVVMEKL